MKQTPIRALGMVWYSEEHFAEVKAMMKDGHLLPRTYLQWQDKAEQGERKFRREGALVVRAHLVPDAFRQYCLRHGLDLDAQGRSHFAASVARDVHGETH